MNFYENFFDFLEHYRKLSRQYPLQGPEDEAALIWDLIEDQELALGEIHSLNAGRHALVKGLKYSASISEEYAGHGVPLIDLVEAAFWCWDDSIVFVRKAEPEKSYFRVDASRQQSLTTQVRRELLGAIRDRSYASLTFRADLKSPDIYAHIDSPYLRVNRTDSLEEAHNLHEKIGRETLDTVSDSFWKVELSLEEEISEEGDTLHAMMSAADPSIIEFEEGRVSEFVESIIDRFTHPEENAILRRRLGLGYEKEWSFQEISEDLEISAQKARRTLSQALRRIRANCERKNAPCPKVAKDGVDLHSRCTPMLRRLEARSQCIEDIQIDRLAALVENSSSQAGSLDDVNAVLRGGDYRVYLNSERWDDIRSALLESGMVTEKKIEGITKKIGVSHKYPCNLPVGVFLQSDYGDLEGFYGFESADILNVVRCIAYLYSQLPDVHGQKAPILDENRSEDEAQPTSDTNSISQTEESLLDELLDTSF